MTRNNVEQSEQVFGEIEVVNELQRDIYLTKELTHDKAVTIANQIREVNREDLLIRNENPNYVAPPINIYINTFGGAVFGGIEIITAIRQSRTVVNGIVTGTCYSMGVPIYLACHNRLVSPFAQFMFHSVSVDSINGDSLMDYREQVQVLHQTQVIVKKLMAEYLEDENHVLITKLDDNKDYFFEVEEAIELGIVDNYVENVDLNFLLGIRTPKKVQTTSGVNARNRKWKAKIK